MGNIRTVGVIGSGIMGSGLAEVASRAEFEVVVRSRTQAGADAVLHTIDVGLTKQVARERLTELIRQALVAPKRRIATKPTYGSEKRRLVAKSVRGEVKSLRGKVEDDD